MYQKIKLNLSSIATQLKKKKGRISVGNWPKICRKFVGSRLNLQVFLGISLNIVQIFLKKKLNTRIQNFF